MQTLTQIPPHPLTFLTAEILSTILPIRVTICLPNPWIDLDVEPNLTLPASRCFVLTKCLWISCFP